VTIGCFFTGYLDSIGLAMASICIKDQRDIGTAVGIAGSVRGGVSTIGTAIYTIILSNKLAQYIPAVVGPAVISAGLPASSVPALLGALGGIGNATAVPGVNANILAVGGLAYQMASVKAFRVVFLSTIAFGLVGIVLAVCSPSVSDQMTNRVATTLHGKGIDGEAVDEKK
jgi:hypothetical protein